MANADKNITLFLPSRTKGVWMSSLEDLLTRLDAATNPDEWEREYARHSFDMTRSQADQVFESERAFADWFGLRFDAGHPGTALPSPVEARARMVRGDSGTPLEAFQVVFDYSPLPSDMSHEELVRFTNNAAAAAMRGGTRLATWIVTRAGLVALALGKPESAWAHFDRLKDEAPHEPELDLLGMFELLRTSEDLLRNPWVRAAVCRLWHEVAMPFLPKLPFPELSPDQKFLEQTFEQLDLLGANEIRHLVHLVVLSVLEGINKQFEGEPLVRDLRRSALRGISQPPAIREIPEWFPTWAKRVLKAGEFRMARLAGLVLHSANKHPELAVDLVIRSARASDLEILWESTELRAQSILQELLAARNVFPPEIADALVAAAFPDHVYRDDAFKLLVNEFELLSQANLQPDGALNELRKMLEGLMTDHSPSQIEKLRTEARVIAGKLATSGRRLSRQDIEMALLGIEPHELTNGMIFRVITESSQNNSVLERLLLALAFLRSVNGTEFEDYWKSRLATLATKEMVALKEPELLEWQLSLIDEALDSSNATHSTAELYYERVKTISAITTLDEDNIGEFLFEVEATVNRALVESNAIIYARATAFWISQIAVFAREYSLIDTEELGHANAALEEAYALNLSPAENANLHRAQAALLGLTQPAAAVNELETGINLLAPEEELWVELTADLIGALAAAERFEDAIERGASFLSHVKSNQSVVGILHLARGRALDSVGRRIEARREFESALGYLRGRDTEREAQVRLWLAHTNSSLGRLEHAEEHRRFLAENYDDLGLGLRRQINLVNAAIAGEAGDRDTQHALIVRALSLARDEDTQIALRLHIALLDLESDRQVEDLDTLLLEGMNSDLGQYEGVLIELLTQYASLSVVEAGFKWARGRSHLSVLARLQDKLGKTEEAKTTLRGALAQCISEHERLACTHLLVTLSAEEHEEELLRLLAELERLLDTVADVPHVRLDLAAGITRIAADKDPVALRSAREHVLRALESELGAHERAFGERTLGQITLNLLKLSSPLSSPSYVQDVEWLLRGLLLPEQEANALRMSVSGLLLLPGPLTHPEVLEMVGSILNLVSDLEGKATLAVRYQWIERRISGEEQPQPKPLGRFDNIPNWIIGILAGRKKSVRPEEIEPFVESLEMVVHVRPDTADRLLALVVASQHNLTKDSRRKLLTAIYEAVQWATIHTTTNWRMLRAKLENTPQNQNHPLLSNIASAIARLTPPNLREMDVTKAQKPMRLSARDQARSHYERAVNLMGNLQIDPFAEGAATKIAEARELLERSVNTGRKKKMPELCSFLVSLGNAWKMAPNEDVEKALRIYESAARLAAESTLKASLWKVQADALWQRGGKDDLGRADKLLERSCRIRKGRLLAETLFSRARVATSHPDLDPIRREQRATQLLMDAVRACPEFVEQDAVMSFLLHRLAEWQRLAPHDHAPSRIREELKAVFPNRLKQIDTPTLSLVELAQVFALHEHSAGQAFQLIHSRFLTPKDLETLPSHVKTMFGPSAWQKVQDHFARKSLIGRITESEALLETLKVLDVNATEAPGILAGRVIVLAYLTRVGRRSVEDVRIATLAALDSIKDMSSGPIQAVLMRELATVWSPNDHHQDPVRDFDLAAQLLRHCVEMEGGEAKATGDSLGLLARALRYSTAGDIQNNLREAKRLYELCLQRPIGPDRIANILHNLAELEDQLGTGSRFERLVNSVKQLEIAVSSAEAPVRRAESMANLAWQQTQLGLLVGGVEGQRFLELAKTTFEVVELAHLESHQRKNLAGNRQVCEARLARLLGGRDAEIQFWREYLSMHNMEHPYNVATAKHNLATALIFGDEASVEQIEEGFCLAEEALQLRTLEHNPRHHWETNFILGQAILTRLVSRQEHLLPMHLSQASMEGRNRFVAALEAARSLGPGEELLESAFGLCEIVMFTRVDLASEAEKAWVYVREAASYLIAHTPSREREAWMAMRIAHHLAYIYAESSHNTQIPHVAFVLEEDHAKDIEGWLARAYEPARRPLRARLARPVEVSAASWDSWRRALDSRNPRIISNQLAQLREEAPGFLLEDHTNEVMWKWLAARLGSIAVAANHLEPISLVLLMWVNDDGERQTRVMGLEMSDQPKPLEEDLNTKGRLTPKHVEHHDASAKWLQRTLVTPILQFIRETPSTVLWCPGPGLRAIAPAAIWGATPVAMTTSFALPELRSAPGRRRSSLVVLADPGPSVSSLNLKEQGIPALRKLEKLAAERGPVRVLASVGERFGRALLGDSKEVRDTPASAKDIVKEASEHEIIIMIAHGEVPSFEQAALLCLNTTGEIDRLSIEQLSQAPDAFAGATVILLSCDSGRISDSIIEPGGVAGTLLSAGARCVIAPLWPVRLDAAEQVGQGILEGIMSGEEPWSVLARINPITKRDSSSLGRPSPPLSDRKAEESVERIQRQGFVVWVG